MIGRKEEVKKKPNVQVKVISEDQAEKEYQRFVDSLGIKPRVLESMDEEKEAIVKGIEWGNITINDDGHIKYKLDDPIDFNGMVSEVDFKHRRLTTKEIEKRSVGKNDIEKSRKIFGLITGTSSGLFEGMNGSDFEAIAVICTFFLK